MKPRITLSAALFLGSAATTAGAGLVLHTGSQQRVNVNFGSETHGLTFVGDAESSGYSVFFQGVQASFDAAFGEPQHLLTDTLQRRIVGAHLSEGLADIDWRLDAVGSTDGLVTFEVPDEAGGVIPLTSGGNSSALHGIGQSSFNLRVGADLQMPAWSPFMSGSIPVGRMKQVAEDDVASVIPLPKTAVMGFAGLAGLGGLLTMRYRRLHLP